MNVPIAEILMQKRSMPRRNRSTGGTILNLQFRQGAVTATLGVALAACAAQFGDPANPSSADQASQARTNVDPGRLASFGRRNPQCLAWTDWRRTCSRLAAGGDEIHCNVSEKHVPKSRIVCLAELRGGDFNVGTGDPAGEPPAYYRFCTAYRIVNGKRWCFEREPDRPFAGFAIAELRHPYCETWSNDEGQYCTENPAHAGLPSCGSMEDAPKSASHLTCDQENQEAMDRRGCARLAHPRFQVRSPSYIGEDGQVLLLLETGPQSPTASVYCREWRN